MHHASRPALIVAVIAGIFASTVAFAQGGASFVPPIDIRNFPPPASERAVPTWISRDSIDPAPYRYFIDVPAQPILVPTVLEVPIPVAPSQRNLLVVDESALENFPSYYRMTSDVIQPKLRISGYGGDVVLPSASANALNELQKMVDGNSATYAQFRLRKDMPPDVAPRSVFTIESDRPITSTGMRVTLDAFVASPTTVELLVAKENVPPETDPYETVIAERSILTAGSYITFPSTTARSWTVYFGHTQPLRISEVSFVESAPVTVNSQSLRFLATPGKAYRIYFDPDRVLQSQGYKETGNLASDKDVRRISALPVMPNPDYTMADSDGDGVTDISDNCSSVANKDQLDIDRNGTGDVCDDFDRDYRPNTVDNCPSVANADQRDTDADGVGDACDGKENRLTEANPWLPWAGMGTAALVLVALFIMIARTANKLPPPTTPPAAGDPQ